MALRKKLGTSVVDNLVGSATADWLLGLGGDDTLSGGGGDDFLDGGTGNDRVYGGVGNDRVLGGAGDDALLGEDGNDVIDGGADNDRIEGGAGDDAATGGDGNDVVNGGAGNDRVLGGAGNDRVDGGIGDDLIDGGAGNDRIYGGAGNDRVYGSDGDDVVTSGDGNDVVYGGIGNDRLYGESGNDTLLGGDGDDTVDGGAGNDRLDGGAGNDRISGGDGNDTVTGGDGNDVINGGAGDDRLLGGDGVDRAVVRGDFSLDLLTRTANGYIVTADGTDTISADIELLSFDDVTIDLATAILEIDGAAAPVSVTTSGTTYKIDVTDGTTVALADGGADHVLESVSLSGNTGPATITSDALTDLELDDITNSVTVVAAAGERTLDLTIEDADLGAGERISDNTATTVNLTLIGENGLDGESTNNFNLSFVSATTLKIVQGEDGEADIKIRIPNVTTIDASGNDGAIEFDTPLDDSVLGNAAVNVIGGAGEEAIRFGNLGVGASASTNPGDGYSGTAKLGGGNDEARLLGAGAFAATGSVDGGSGFDTLRMATDIAAAISATNAAESHISGFEELFLTFSAAAAPVTHTVNVANLDSLPNIRINGTTAATAANTTLNLNNVSSDGTITLIDPNSTGSSAVTDESFGTINITLAGSSSGDSLTIKLVGQNQTGTDNANSTGAVTVNGAETVTIVAQSRDASETDPFSQNFTLNGAKTVNIHGDAGAVTTITGSTSLNLSLDGVDLTSSESIVASSATSVKLILSGDNGLDGAATNSTNLNFSSATTVTVTGGEDSSADIKWNVAAATTINASGNAGEIEFDTPLDDSILAAAGGGASYSFLGGSGGEAVRFGNLGTGNSASTNAGLGLQGTVDLGGGDDEARLLGAGAFNGGHVVGGSGEDTLRLTFAVAEAIGDITASATGFEVLRLDTPTGTHTVDVSNLGEFGEIKLFGVAAGGTNSLTNVEDGANIAFTTTSANDAFGTVNVTLEGAGPHSLGLAFTGLQSLGGDDTGTIHVTNAETVSIATQSNDSSPADPFAQVLNLDATTSITVEGNTGWNFDNGSIALVTTIDASGVTGTGAVGGVTATAVASNVEFTGGAGNDVFVGSAGADTLLGGGGADRLEGKGGGDILTGGLGADIFVFTLPADGGDTITDFDVVADQFEISAAGFGGGLTNGVDLVAGTSFFVDGAATSGAGAFLYTTASGVLQWDADGNGAGAAVTIATLATKPALTVADFDIIA